MPGPSPLGALVSLFYDGTGPIQSGHYLQTPTGRAYLVEQVRRQETGGYVGRWHLKATVIHERDLTAAMAQAAINDEDEIVVHRLHWYRRNPRRR